MKKEFDETFLQECLSELRDGWRVTIRTERSNRHQRRRVRDALIRLGATAEMMSLVTIE